jgi:hypothetical protein
MRSGRFGRVGMRKRPPDLPLNAYEWALTVLVFGWVIYSLLPVVQWIGVQLAR